MTVFDNFLARYPLGTKIDTDGFPADQPFQCFDAVLAYMRMASNNPGLYVRCASSGYVKDWWNDFDKNGLSQWFDRIPWNQQGQRGDIIIYGNAPLTPVSHVGVLYADNGNTQDIYGQNQPHPYTTRINLTSNGILGYLRLKNQGVSNMAIIDESMKTQIRIVSSEVKGWNRAEVHSGKFDDREFNAWKGQSVSKFLQQAWDEGGWYRQLKDTWKAAFDEKGGKEEAIKKLTAQLVQAQTDLGTARSGKNTADLQLTTANSTIASQNKTIDDLKKQLQAASVTASQGDAGITPADPINTSKLNELIVLVVEWIKKLGGNK